MKVSNIKIKPSFSRTNPSLEKLNVCRKYFKDNGKLDSKIVVNQKNYLIDGYIRYLVLIENDVDEIDVVRKKPSNNQTEKVYVYGYHSNSDKEYVWKVPKGLSTNNIFVGGKVLVNTRFGLKPITVTRVEKSINPPSPLPIKRVVRCLEG